MRRVVLLAVLALLAAVASAKMSHSYHKWAKGYYSKKMAHHGRLRDYYWRLYNAARVRAAAKRSAYKNAMSRYRSNKNAQSHATSKAAVHLKLAQKYKRQYLSYKGLAGRYHAYYSAAIKAKATYLRLYRVYLKRYNTYKSQAANYLRLSKANTAHANAQMALYHKYMRLYRSYKRQGQAYYRTALNCLHRAQRAQKACGNYKNIAARYYKLYIKHKKKRDFAWTALHHNGKAYYYWKKQGVYLAYHKFYKMMHFYTRNAMYSRLAKKYYSLYLTHKAAYIKHFNKHKAARSKVHIVAASTAQQEYPVLDASAVTTEQGDMVDENEAAVAEQTFQVVDPEVENEVDEAVQEDSVEADTTEDEAQAANVGDEDVMDQVADTEVELE